MFTFKTALAATALLAISVASFDQASARPAWFGPGSGPVSPYSNFKGFQQVPRQPAARTPINTVRSRNTSQPSNGAYHCVPNVGLVGANGVCPD